MIVDHKLRIGGAAMLYRVKIKIRVNSAITTTSVEVTAPNATIAKALAEQQYGKRNVLSVVKA